MQPWAWHLVVSYEEAKVLEASFSQAEHELANMMLPRGNVITDADGDPDSVNLDLPDTINCEVLPPLEQAALGSLVDINPLLLDFGVWQSGDPS